jgi:serine/threonine protein kinase
VEPKSFDHYKPIRLIGDGVMGSVYLAEDTRSGNRVAIKALHPNIATDQRASNEFLGYAIISATRLRHDNIAEITDYGMCEGSPYVVMDYLEINLSQALRDKSRLPLETALKVASGISHALEWAHHCGVSHGHLKPNNIFWDSDGTLKVSDFGLLKDQAFSEGMTSQPESDSIYQPSDLNDSGWTNIKIDIYSLGILFFEMLVGRVPTPTELQGESVDTLAISNVGLDAQVAEDIVRIISKATKSGLGYSDPAELLSDIEELAALLSQAAAPPSTVPDSYESEFGILGKELHPGQTGSPSTPDVFQTAPADVVPVDPAPGEQESEPPIASQESVPPQPAPGIRHMLLAPLRSISESFRKYLRQPPRAQQTENEGAKPSTRAIPAFLQLTRYPLRVQIGMAVALIFSIALAGVVIPRQIMNPTQTPTPIPLSCSETERVIVEGAGYSLTSGLLIDAQANLTNSCNKWARVRPEVVAYDKEGAKISGESFYPTVLADSDFMWLASGQTKSLEVGYRLDQKADDIGQVTLRVTYEFTDPGT